MTVKVKATQAHDNEYGVREGTADYQKKAGAVYEVPDDAAAQLLVDAGLAEKVKGSADDRKG